MDRGIPSEVILREVREPAREIFYLVGTPKGKIRQYEKKWLDLPQKVRELAKLASSIGSSLLANRHLSCQPPEV
jgi:hypothetical protein